MGSEASICPCLCVCVASHGCLAPVSPFCSLALGCADRWALLLCPLTWSVPVDVSGLGVGGVCMRSESLKLPGLSDPLLSTVSP